MQTSAGHTRKPATRGRAIPFLCDSFVARTAWFLWLLLLGTAPGHGTIYLTLSGIPGGSTAKAFPGAIEVSSMQHAISRVVSSRPGGTAPASHSQFTFTKVTDAATPLLYDAATHGGPLDQAEIDFVSNTPTATLFYKVVLNQVYVSSISTAAGGSVPIDGFSLFYEKISWSYIQVSGTRTATWDRVSNSGTNNFVPGDSDSDGLPDAWEMQYFGTLAYGPNDDPDHDGLTNYQEYLAGTNPNDPNSVLSVTQIDAGHGQVHLAWNSVAGKNYTIYSATQIDGAYTPLLTMPSAGDGQTSTNLTGSAFNQFYRVGVQ